MATFIHGIAASENIDSSGERIIIAGVDISSLERDGVFNYEHDQAKGPDGQPLTIKLPSNIVGKILKARKIFQESDCEDDHQKYFWQKCQTPFVYVMGELMDDYKDSAREVAGMFMYDADRKGKQEANVANFSIEGAKIEKKGIDITRSIARKVTITTHPCNKAAVSEMVKTPDAKNGDIDALFKTEEIQIEVFKFEPTKPTVVQDMAKHAEVLGIQPMKKALGTPTSAPGLQVKPPAAPGAGDKGKLASPTSNPGKSIGKTKAGKDVMSHAKIHEYHEFHAEDHRNAAVLHGHAANAANAAKNWKLADHHNQKMKLHNSAAAGLERKGNRLNVALKQRSARAAAAPLLGKSMTADSGESAPSQKTGGAALAKETVDKKLHKTSWLARAEAEYKIWNKREEFQEFMKKRMPNLAKGEIDAIGQTLALKKSLDAEKSLETMTGMEKSLKFGTPEDQAAVAAAIEERKKNPPPKSEPKKKAPDIKAPMDGEVSHTSGYGADHETVHLHSGHEVHGVKKGKFKAGDKVHVKPHLMGTVLIDHKK